MAGIYALEGPERSTVGVCGPAHDDGARLLCVEFGAAVLDDEGAIGFLNLVDGVLGVNGVKLRAAARTCACRTDIFAVVVLDGELAIHFPETPDAVGGEGLLAETHTVGFAVVVHHLAGAVSLGGGVLDVVPMHVALGAILGQAGLVFCCGRADAHLEVLEDHAVAVRAREGEGDALLGAVGDFVCLHGAGGGVLVALVGGEGEAVGVAAVDDAHLVTVDDVARGCGKGVGGRTCLARHQL